MADIKAIKGTNGTTYSIVDRYSKWGGNNLLKNIPKKYVSSDYDAYHLYFTENLVAGETYTVQLWDVNVYHSAKTQAQTNICLYWGGGSIQLVNFNNCWTAQTNNYHADHLQATFTVTSANASGSGATNAWFNIYNSVGYVSGTLSMSIGKWKLEKGHKATDWSPCWEDIFTINDEELDVNI